MRIEALRPLVAALLITAASCEGVTGPDDGGSTGFGLLVERRSASGQRSFYVTSPTGDGVTPFTGVPSDASTLIPSPDGKTIAYLRDAGDGFIELWAMDRDGANRRALLAGTHDVENAAWSSDGSKLVMSVSTDTRTNDIATITATGTGLTYLTTDPLPGVIFDRDPSWSRDGTRIAFSSNASGTRRLWVMNADGSNQHQVLPTTFPATMSQPVWAPDTTDFIAVVSATDAGNGIAFVRADGSDFKHIPISPAPSDLVWLPDGNVAYVANPNGDYDLFRVDRVSGTTTQLTSRRDSDVRAAVLTDVAPFAWLGTAAAVTYNINRPVATDLIGTDLLTDGREDVLVLTPLLNELRLMRGTPNGSLQAVGSLFAESDVFALRPGRISPDLAPDLVGIGDSAAYLWRGRADGPGISARIGMAGLLRDAAVIDLDASGRDEIVSLVENGTQPYRIKTHTVSGTDVILLASDMVTTRTGGRHLCAGDITGDGRADVVITGGTTSLGAFLAAGRGDLGLDQPVAAGQNLATDIDALAYCADFDNDGRTDLLTFTPGVASGLGVHRSNGASFSTLSRIMPAATSIAIADIDRDGDLDIIMTPGSGAEILIVKNRGDGHFAQPTSVLLTNGPTVVTVADLNGDNWPDIVAIEVNGGLVVLLSRGRSGM